MNKKLLSLLIAAGLVLGVSQAYAIDITIADWNPGNSFGGGLGTAGEDNETEPGTIASQAWDMEAFAHVGNTLYIIGGYNMQAGASGSGGSTVPGMLTPGDLFIKVGGTQPSPNPTANGTGTVFNSIYGYNYVVDLTQPVGAMGSFAAVYNLAGTSVLNTAVYDAFGANPWKYANDGSALNASNTSITYTAGLDDAATLALTGVALAGGSHNVLAVDVGWLSAPFGTNVWFSYTMECGNDSLKGKDSGGFDRVPDGTSSVLLIGLGLAAMAFFGSRRR